MHTEKDGSVYLSLRPEGEVVRERRGRAFLPSPTPPPDTQANRKLPRQNSR